MITFIFRSKSFEVLFEAFPQVILGAFTIQELQLWEPLNIISVVISLFSLVYGMGDLLAWVRKGPNADFISIVWGALSVMIDAVLRSLFLTYIFSITKWYAFLVVPLYIFIMFITICISKKTVSVNIVEFLSSLFSFPCSCFEGPEVECFLRPRSKGVFSFIFIVSFPFAIIATNTKHFDVIGFSLNSPLPENSTIDCTNICENDFNDICNERWKYLDYSQHMTIQIILSLLFGLSIFEWILETCFDFMPYNKLYKDDEATNEQENENSDKDSKEDYTNEQENENSVKDLKEDNKNSNKDPEEGIPLQTL